MAKSRPLASKEPLRWNTLGVAHYRLDEWQKGLDALGKSAELNGIPTAHDLYFLALCRHRLGQVNEVRADLVRAKTWQERAKLNANLATEPAGIRAEVAATLANQPPL